MASGDLLCWWSALNNEPPPSNMATPDWIVNTGDTPDDAIPCLDFDPGASREYATFSGYMPSSYSGGGVTLKLLWTSESASAQAVVWEAAFKRFQDNTDDIDANNFAAANTVTATKNATARVINYDSITFTNGADMDSVAADEWFRIQIARDAGNASDTMTANDAELVAVVLLET